MRETQTKLIDGVPYTVRQLGALTGRKVLARGPSLRNLDDATMDYICDAFAQSTTIPLAIEATKASSVAIKLSDVFDDHFAGRYGAMMSWLAFCMELNFGDIGFTSPGADPGKAQSDSQAASTGPLGE